jgi:hypothetical protein
MKHYAELSNLESEIIRLDTLQSLLRLITEGIDSAGENDIKNSMWHISEVVEDINQKMSEQFQQLWNNVREDSWNKK